MRIEEIRVAQFKTFQKLSLSLDPYNVVIGSNAAGKSNFIDIFRFLKDIAERGLRDAIALQGGADCLRNLCTVSQDPLSIEVKIDCSNALPIFRFCREGGELVELVIRSWRYRLELYPTLSIPPFEETIEVYCSAGMPNPETRTESEVESKITIARRRDGRMEYSVSPSETGLPEGSPPSGSLTISAERSLLEDPFCIPPFAFLVYSVKSYFSRMGIYDPDPNLARRLKFTGPVSLEPDGSNLAIALEHLLADERKREEFVTLMNDILPFVQGVEVTEFRGLPHIAAMREAYCEGILTPATLLSTGTIHLTLLVFILFFEDRNPVILEEPFRNIHPYLASRFMDFIRDVSTRLDKQVIFTTHHPTVVKHAGEKLLMVRRDQNGFSCILRPFEQEEIKAYLDYLNIEEIFVQNLL